MNVFKKSVVCSLAILSLSLHGTPINFIVPSQITAGSYTISSPGTYLLVDDTTFSPGASSTAITISSDNVTLDLNGKYLIGGNNNANTGIELPSSANDIIIKNGFVSDFAGFGFRADAGATYTTITLENLTIKNRNKTGLGMSFAGASDCFVTNCHCSGAAEGGSFSGCQRFQIVDSTFSNNIDFGLDIFNCKSFKIINCQTNFSVSNGGLGTGVDTCDSFIFRNCIFNGNISTGVIAGLGAQVFGSSCVSFLDCEFCNNSNGAPSSTANDAAGLDIQDSTGVIVKNSFFNENFTTTGTASGLRISGASHGNYIESCIAADNNATGTGHVNGFDLRTTSSNNFFVNCVALRNRSTSGVSTGFSTLSGSIANIFKNCEAYDNTGSADNRGFLDENATALNWYAGNVAFGHGSHTSNYSTPYVFSLISLGINSAPGTGTFDERGIDNISVA